jgi:hypothetical protein
MIYYLSIGKYETILFYSPLLQLLLSDRAGPGRPRVGSGRAKSGALALGPMRAGPGHQNPGPTLALLGSGRVDPGPTGARPCPWTVYFSVLNMSFDVPCSQEWKMRTMLYNTYNNIYLIQKKAKETDEYWGHTRCRRRARRRAWHIAS